MEHAEYLIKKIYMYVRVRARARVCVALQLAHCIEKLINFNLT